MYSTLKLLAGTTVILFVSFVISGLNPLYCFIVLVPQTFVALPICYYERKYGVRIVAFPKNLSIHNQPFPFLTGQLPLTTYHQLAGLAFAQFPENKRSLLKTVG